MAIDVEAKRMAKRCGLKVAKINFGMFDYDAYVVIGSLKGAYKFAAWVHESDENYPDSNPDQQHYGAKGRTLWCHGFPPVVWMPRIPKTPAEHGTLAHEFLHVVGMLTRWAGMDFGRDSEEAYCHALGHGVREALGQISG